MTPDGRFRAPSGGQRMPLSMKLLVVAVGVALLGGALTLAALALWVAASLLPVVLIAAGIAWATLKYRGWRRRSGATNINAYPPR
jgi:hypothetical protein